MDIDKVLLGVKSADFALPVVGQLHAVKGLHDLAFVAQARTERFGVFSA